jgi:molecular chaperone GrpE
MMHDSLGEEAILAQFRHWLQETRDENERLDREAFGPEEDPPAVGLCDLIEEFTALRHELKLQTKNGRSLQEQAEALLPPLRQAIDQFRSVQPKEAKAAWSAGKGLAESLADLDEALERGRKEIEKSKQRIVEDCASAFQAGVTKLYKKRFLAWRPLLRAFHEDVLAFYRNELLKTQIDLFDAQLEGYSLMQARLRRALAAEEVERIACAGRPVDPELMTVLEVVETIEHPPGHVCDEVRTGYLWRGRVLRYAEVRAARAPLA